MRITDGDLRALEIDVQDALARDDRSALDLRGQGVTSVVLAAPTAAPVVACKRVPPFVDLGAFERYREVVLANIDQMRAAGIDVVDTEVRLVEVEGHLAGYIVQPLIPAETLGEAVLGAAEPDPGHPLAVGIVEAVGRFTTERRGIDAQVGNWSWSEGRLSYLDVTTPFLFDDDGPVMDLELFLRSAAPVVRPLYARELPRSMARWLDPRHALLDLVGNLYKLDLDNWVEPITAAANTVAHPPITLDEARDYYSAEVKTWTMLHRLMRGYDHWVRTVRRRTPLGFQPPPDYDPVAWRAKQRAWGP